MPDSTPSLALAAPASPPLRRMLSWTGVAPLGAFLLLHAAATARATRGPEAFGRVADWLGRVPALAGLELLFVYAPLLVHAGIGTWLVATRRPLAAESPYPPAVRAWVRATGLVALAFVALHVPELRLQRWDQAPDGAVMQTVLDAGLSSTRWGVPWHALAYLVGCAAATFHFAAGAWGALVGRYPGTSARARRAVAWALGALGAALLVVFASSVVYHATGSRLLGGPAPVQAGTEPCPAASK